MALNQILLHFLGFQSVEFGVLVKFDVFNVLIELSECIFVTLCSSLLHVNRMLQELNSTSPVFLSLNQPLVMLLFLHLQLLFHPVDALEPGSLL